MFDIKRIMRGTILRYITGMAMAKKRNDSMYARYKKYNQTRMQMKKKIKQKYGSRAKIYGLVV